LLLPLSRAKDPDFHGEHSSAALSWFLTFMWRYTTVAQLARQTAVFAVLHLALRVPVANLGLFWAAPALMRCASQVAFD